MMLDGQGDMNSRLKWATNLDVVGYLQIICERNSMGTGDIAERFEVVHGQLLPESVPLMYTSNRTNDTYRISLHPNTTDELGQHVEGDFDTSHGLDYSNRNSVRFRVNESLRW